MKTKTRSAPRWGRVAQRAVFLVVSLALLAGGVLTLPSAAGRVARQYLNAAFSYDYLALYDLFDPAVLDRELERAGLDRAGMEAVAQYNRQAVEGYVSQVESDHGLTVSYRWKLTGERALAEEELAALKSRDAADGFSTELLAARQVSALTAARLTGQGRTETLERELSLTVVQTPQGWFLDRESMHVFLTLLYALPDFAQERFGG